MHSTRQEFDNGYMGPKIHECLTLVPKGPVDDFCNCNKYVPSSNLEYLEWLYDKKSKSKGEINV